MRMVSQSPTYLPTYYLPTIYLPKAKEWSSEIPFEETDRVAIQLLECLLFVNIYLNCSRDQINSSFGIWSLLLGLLLLYYCVRRCYVAVGIESAIFLGVSEHNVCVMPCFDWIIDENSSGKKEKKGEKRLKGDSGLRIVCSRRRYLGKCSGSLR